MTRPRTPMEKTIPPAYGATQNEISVVKGLALLYLADEGAFKPFFDHFGGKPKRWWWWSEKRRKSYVRGCLLGWFPTLMLWKNTNDILYTVPPPSEHSNVYSQMAELHKQVITVCPIDIKFEGDRELWAGQVYTAMATAVIARQ